MYGIRHTFANTGGELEESFVDIVCVFAKSEWGNDTVKLCTVRQDRFEGTDLYVLGVPIDITMAYSRKNKMKELSYRVYEGVTIDFGLRIGNGKVTFETPVLVIGIETALGICKHNLGVVMETIKTHISDILNVGMDEYFQANGVA